MKAGVFLRFSLTSLLIHRVIIEAISDLERDTVLEFEVLLGDKPSSVLAREDDELELPREVLELELELELLLELVLDLESQSSLLLFLLL